MANNNNSLRGISYFENWYEAEGVPTAGGGKETPVRDFLRTFAQSERRCVVRDLEDKGLAASMASALATARRSLNYDNDHIRIARRGTKVFLENTHVEEDRKPELVGSARIWKL